MLFRNINAAAAGAIGTNCELILSNVEKPSIQLINSINPIEPEIIKLNLDTNLSQSVLVLNKLLYVILFTNLFTA